jgi:hypothetical protein
MDYVNITNSNVTMDYVNITNSNVTMDYVNITNSNVTMDYVNKQIPRRDESRLSGTSFKFVQM